MSSLFCGLSQWRHERRQRRRIEQAAQHLDQLPSWNAPDNTTIMEAFEWHVPADHQHWRRLQRALPSLKAIGIDTLLLPPGTKAMSPSGNGYDPYDLYDIGEFDQKGSRPTKWGSKEELQALTAHAKSLGMGVYWDAVLNHKAGADSTERFSAVRVDARQRDVDIAPAREIEGWVGFNFAGRGNRYSSMEYHWPHFSGVDRDESRKENAIYRIVGANKKRWAEDVSLENGNYDYLMFADLDYSHPEVQHDVLNWVDWLAEQLPLSGIRLDAAKHWSVAFQKKLVDRVRAAFGADCFIVSEYWKEQTGFILNYLEKMECKLSVFDSALVGRFSTISRTKGADIRRVFEGTLVQSKPEYAVAPPYNPSPALVEPYFVPLAYALILLQNTGQPCVFYGDLYGLRGGVKHPTAPACGGRLPILTQARKLYAYGEQEDYYDQPNCIGFVRYGNRQHPWGLACIMSNAEATRKRMFVGRQHAKERWTDILEWNDEVVTIDRNGYGTFPVARLSVSVWVNYAADGREKIVRDL
ncbi:glycoside hydrolase superfamily [Aspergillus ambiguus]|uniref:alpha-amylase n=1 Tax=Aspergillus ambiguus TaxID=176160 RepID=UPI003CCD39A6